MHIAHNFALCIQCVYLIVMIKYICDWNRNDIRIYLIILLRRYLCKNEIQQIDF